MDINHWQRRLSELCEEHLVPGASLAVLVDGEVHECATGVLHRGTGVEATTDSLFQIGSITKLYTATLVMQLVAEGVLDLDAPVVTVLPEFAVADEVATKTVTPRQLLSHTSGIDGDFFHDTGRGDDCVAAYVAACAGLGQNHPPGATMSYCNSGFTVLGRIVEVLTGQVWDVALRERLLDPIGAHRTVTLPEDVLRFRSALGHLGEPGEEPVPAPVWGLARSAGPAGTINATAADVLRFARLHLDGGRAPDGTVVLPAEHVAAMHRPFVQLPAGHAARMCWGLGWITYDWPGGPVIGHDGATVGQKAFLRVVPGAGVAAVLLTNGGVPAEVSQRLFAELLGEHAGVVVPTFEPPAEPPEVDLSRYVGSYVREGYDVEVSERDGLLRLRGESTGELAAINAVTEAVLVPVEEGLFAARRNEHEPWSPVVFYTLPDGSPYLHFSMRAAPRSRRDAT
ncbi:CubicO group peptidase (beta-lactamase class C family) [Saccharothrix saharensis]|uniref:CubicO group peptidase (Beta-lactamase class C family) n=1 Tax=Saccharothrix saharensis TaxID=571190 RepID=A0A543JPY1_9PSEU|nr:serine hydrolase domain-containing protein [Saccharothrix saharensis]TQM84921.1 CubicO group peptidase (beta-lactamase class C family) [Saccharothrix saharensis]